MKRKENYQMINCCPICFEYLGSPSVGSLTRFCRSGHYSYYRTGDCSSVRIGPFWFHYYEGDETARKLIQGAIEHQREKEADTEVEKNYRKHWKEIIEPNGTVDLEQLKKELFDYSEMMDRYGKVICHVTRGRLSYLTYPAETVIQQADEAMEDEIDAAVYEALKNEHEEEGAAQ